MQVLWYGVEGAVSPSPIRMAPSWSWASVDGALRWENSLTDARYSCNLSVPPSAISLDPSPEKMISILMTFEGYIASVQRGTGHGPDGNLLSLLDPKKHACCYSLLGTSETEIGWIVLDEGDLEKGPLIAAGISDNEGDDGWADCSYNVLILTPDAERQACYRRVGIGEITKTSVFPDKRNIQHTIRIS